MDDQTSQHRAKTRQGSVVRLVSRKQKSMHQFDLVEIQLRRLRLQTFIYWLAVAIVQFVDVVVDLVNFVLVLVDDGSRGLYDVPSFDDQQEVFFVHSGEQEAFLGKVWLSVKSANQTMQIKIEKVAGRAHCWLTDVLMSQTSATKLACSGQQRLP